MSNLFLVRTPVEILIHLQPLSTQSTIDHDELAEITKLSELAYAAQDEGALETALRLEKTAYSACLQLHQAVDSRNEHLLLLSAAKLYNMGQLHYRMGQADEARLCFEEARELDAEAGNSVGQAAALRSLGFIQQDEGNLLGALDLHTEALQLDTEAGYDYGVAVGLANIGAIYLELGDFRLSWNYLKEARLILGALGQVAETEQVEQLLKEADSQMV